MRLTTWTVSSELVGVAVRFGIHGKVSSIFRTGAMNISAIIRHESVAPYPFAPLGLIVAPADMARSFVGETLVGTNTHSDAFDPGREAFLRA